MSEEWVELGLTCRALVWSNDATVGRGIFMGCDNKLYLYKVEEDSYYYKGALDSGYNIKRLWVNASDSNNIYGAAWGEPNENAQTIVKIFNFDGTSLSAEITINNVFTGEFLYRDGYNTMSDLQVFGNWDGTYIGGENLSLPFYQYIETNSIYTTSPYAESVIATATTVSSTGTTIYSTAYPIGMLDGSYGSGYYNGYSRLIHSPAEKALNLRFSYGQRGCFELIPHYKSKGGLFYAIIGNRGAIVDGMGAISYKIYDIAGDTSYSIYTSSEETMNEYTIGGLPTYPTCCAPFENTDSVVFGVMCWNENTSNRSTSYVLRLSKLEYGTVPSDPYSSLLTMYSSTADIVIPLFSGNIIDRRYRTFIDLVVAGDKVYTLFFNRNLLHSACAFGVGYLSTYHSAHSIGNYWEFPTCPRRIVNTPSNVSYFTSANGCLYRYASLANLTICDNGNTYNSTETNISSNLICIPYNEINAIDIERTRTEDMIFGISAPYFPNETQENPTIGKYYLWKYDNYISDRIELADFTDMTIWDAISKLTECAIDYSIGFDTDNEGSFFLTDKSSDTYTIALDISTDEIDKNLISIEKDRGLDEVFNYAEATPYVVTLSDISKELYVAPRNTTAEENKRVNVDDIYVDSTTHHNTSLRLICTKKGNVDESYTEMENNALFKWQLYETQIEAMVIGDVAAGATSVLVASTFRGGLSSTKTDINGNTIDYILDDAINLGDYITVVDPDTQTEETRRITAIADTTLTIDSAFSFDIASSTIVVITHPFDLTDTSVSWSDEGVTTLSADATNASTIYVTSIRDLSEYMVVSCEGDSPTFARISDIGDYDTDSSGYSLTLVGNTVTADAGAIVYAYYAPSKDSSSEYSYFDIGSTGIKLKISPESTSLNNEFWVGDRITITTEGLISEANEQSKQTAYNLTSMSERGRIEFPSINNRFINRTLAKHIVRKIVNDYGDPHYIITINNTLYPTLRFIGDDNNLIRVRLYSKRMFPNYSEVILYPRSIQHNLKQGTTTIVGRDVTAY